MSSSDRYCGTADLLTGDTEFGTVDEKQLYVNAAADEIDGILGFRYSLPIPALASLSEHTKLILKTCNAHLATGRLIMAYAGTGGLDTITQQYGASLVKQALTTLEAIKNGSLDLPGLTPLPTTAGGDGPLLINTDATSAVDAFYGWANGGVGGYIERGLAGDPAIWRPG